MVHYKSQATNLSLKHQAHTESCLSVMVLLVMELLQLMLLMVRYSVVVVLLHAHGLWVAVALCVGHDGG